MLVNRSLIAGHSRQANLPMKHQPAASRYTNWYSQQC